MASVRIYPGKIFAGHVGGLYRQIRTKSTNTEKTGAVGSLLPVGHVAGLGNPEVMAGCRS